jgi:hypothetical protein
MIFFDFLKGQGIPSSILALVTAIGDVRSVTIFYLFNLRCILPLTYCINDAAPLLNGNCPFSFSYPRLIISE